MKRRFFDALKETMDFCSLAEQVYRHSTLPDLARPLRRAFRPDSPVVCPGFGFDWYVNPFYTRYVREILSLRESLGAEDPLEVKKSLAEPFRSPEGSRILFSLCASTSADLHHVTIVYQQNEKRSSFLDANWMQTHKPSPLHAWYAFAHLCASTNKGISM